MNGNLFIFNMNIMITEEQLSSLVDETLIGKKVMVR